MKKLGMLLLGIILLSACGGGSGSSKTTATAQGSTATTTAASATTATAAATTSTNTATPAAIVGTASETAAATTTASTSATTTSTSAATSAATSTTAAATSQSTTAATTVTTSIPSQATSTGPIPKETLQGALLALSDMPDGWTAAPPDTSSDGESTGFCQPDAQSGIDQSRATADYQQEDQGLFVTEILTGFKAGDSSKWMDWLKSGVNCTQATDSSSGTPTTYDVAPLSFPTIGDQMYAYRLTTTDPTLGTIAFDIVYSRVGNCVASVANLGLGQVDTNLTQSTVQKAVDKAKPACG